MKTRPNDAGDVIADKKVELLEPSLLNIEIQNDAPQRQPAASHVPLKSTIEMEQKKETSALQDNLPEDAYKHILKFLSAKELQTVAEVSQYTRKLAYKLYDEKTCDFLAEKMKDSQLWRYLPLFAKNADEKNGLSVTDYLQAEIGQAEIDNEWVQKLNILSFKDLIERAVDTTWFTHKKNADLREGIRWRPREVRIWLLDMASRGIVDDNRPQSLNGFINVLAGANTMWPFLNRWEAYHKVEFLIKHCIFSLMVDNLENSNLPSVLVDVQKYLLITSPNFAPYIYGHHLLLIDELYYSFPNLFHYLTVKPIINDDSSSPVSAVQLRRIKRFVTNVSELELIEIIKESAINNELHALIIDLLKMNDNLIKRKFSLNVLMTIIRARYPIDKNYITTYGPYEAGLVEYVLSSEQLLAQLTTDLHQDNLLELLVRLPFNKVSQLFRLQHVVSSLTMPILLRWLEAPVLGIYGITSYRFEANGRAMLILINDAMLRKRTIDEVALIAGYVGGYAQELFKNKVFKAWLSDMQTDERQLFFSKLHKIGIKEKKNYFVEVISEQNKVNAEQAEIKATESGVKMLEPEVKSISKWRKIAWIVGAIIVGLIGVGLMATGFGSGFGVALIASAVSAAGFLTIGIVGALVTSIAIAFGIIKGIQNEKDNEPQIKINTAFNSSYQNSLSELIADSAKGEIIGAKNQPSRSSVSESTSSLVIDRKKLDKGLNQSESFDTDRLPISPQI